MAQLLTSCCEQRGGAAAGIGAGIVLKKINTQTSDAPLLTTRTQQYKRAHPSTLARMQRLLSSCGTALILIIAGLSATIYNYIYNC